MLSRINHIVAGRNGRVVVVCVLLTVFLIEAASSMASKTPTFDEQFHLYSGYGYLMLRDYSIGLAQPPLARWLAAVPLILTADDVPRGLWDAPRPTGSSRSMWWQYEAAREFYYGLNNPARSLFWSRFVMVLVGALLAFVVYKWAYEVFGPQAAFLALLFCVFDPNLIAHARLVNTDVTASLGIFVSVYLMWRYSEKVSRAWLCASGAAAGAAILSKYSAVIVLPVLLILYAYSVFRRPAQEDDAKDISIRRVITDLLILGGSIFIVCWAFYLPSLGTQFHRPGFEEFASAMGMAPSIWSRFLHFGFRWMPLPSDFLNGLTFVIDQQRNPAPAFLMGQYSGHGWWSYFPVAVLIKSPITLIVGVVLSCLLALGKRMKIAAKDGLYLVVPVVLIMGSAMASGLNIGLRHILPIYPFLFVFAGGIMTADGIKKPIGKVVVAVMCGWLMLSSLKIYPHYLAYFNEIIGGPDNGHKYLIDSNIDWGQDLDGLSDYLKERGIENVWLEYFGMALPEKHGIDYRPLPCEPVKGTIAISVTLLEGRKGPSCYQWLKEGAPVEKIGYSIFVYEVEE